MLSGVQTGKLRITVAVVAAYIEDFPYDWTSHHLRDEIPASSPLMQEYLSGYNGSSCRSSYFSVMMFTVEQSLTEQIISPIKPEIILRFLRKISFR